MLDYERKIELYSVYIYITHDNQNRIIRVNFPNYFHYTYEYQSNSRRLRWNRYSNALRTEYLNGSLWTPVVFTVIQ
jgi:hypothetical protein